MATSLPSDVYDIDSLPNVLPTKLGPSKTSAELFKSRPDLSEPDMEIEVLNKKREVVKKFEAHQDVLAERSSVFRALFAKSQKKENEKKMSKLILEITSFSHEVIEQMLIYMYMGRRPRHLNQMDFSLDLLECAITYNITELMILCQNMLGERIPTLKWKHIFKLLELYGKCDEDDGSNELQILMKKVKEYYGKHEDTLRKSREFIAASIKYPKIPFELWSSKDVSDQEAEDSFIIG